MLVNKSTNGVVAVSSVAIDNNNILSEKWEEIPPGIVYRLNLSNGEETSLSIPRIVNRDIPGMLKMVSQIQTPLIQNDTTSKLSKESTPENDAAKGLLELLDRAVKRRVMKAPLPKSQSTDDASVAVLFSGGIDSVVLAALSHRHVPSNQPIDLVNVSFYANAAIAGSSATPKSPDRLAAILSYQELLSLFPERKWRFIAVDVPYEEVLEHEKHILRLISPLDSTMDFNIGTAFYFAGRGRGKVLGAKEVEDVTRGLESRTGGRIEGETKSSEEPLLRFATENGRGSLNARPTCIRDGCTRLAPYSGCIFQACKFCCGKVQGRISSYLGRSAKLCPVHNCNSKSSSEKKTPTSVILDEVGTHQMQNGSKTRTVTSSAKILLSGVGADEQMAGYGRHRTTYQRGGAEALLVELEIEVKRLWLRNLGRDDRCLSYHGKETRFPYLDEDVMAYLEAVPLGSKCDMTRPLGEGDKRILREVARMLGVMVSNSHYLQVLARYKILIQCLDAHVIVASSYNPFLGVLDPRKTRHTIWKPYCQSQRQKSLW